MNSNRRQGWRSPARMVTLAVAFALPVHTEDPKPATPAAPAVVSPPLPASAFQAAKFLLTKLKELDPREERLALASLEAAPGKH